jgi:putative ABC transport system permease protein
VSALHPGSAIPPSLNVAAGRFVEESDLSASTPVIVLSKGLASKFSPVDSVLLGKFVHVDGRGHRVIGLLEGDSAERVSRGYVALTQEIVRRSASERRQYPFMMIKASRLELVEPVRVRVNRWLEKRFGAVDRDFAVSVSSQRLAQVSQAMFVFKLGMGFITGISLLVGGIGIMNVLLASVSERTREIGVRRAAGARATDILAQFLAESVAIAGAGSILGVALGFLASAIGTAVIRSLTGAPLGMSFTWIPVLVGVGAASIVGIAFGIYPARRAAKLSPTDAIRYE